jgi:hypothetical protein
MFTPFGVLDVFYVLDVLDVLGVPGVLNVLTGAIAYNFTIRNHIDRTDRSDARTLRFHHLRKTPSATTPSKTLAPP